MEELCMVNEKKLFKKDRIEHRQTILNINSNIFRTTRQEITFLLEHNICKTLIIKE